MISTQSTVTTLPEVLYEALKANPCTRRDLERAAAVKGFAAFQVEVALSKARKLGLFACEPMYRLTEDAQIPEPKAAPAFSGIDLGIPGSDVTVRMPVAPKAAGLGRRMSPFWSDVLSSVRTLGVGESFRLSIPREVIPPRFSARVAAQITYWRTAGRIEGSRFSTRTTRHHVVVTRVA